MGELIVMSDNVYVTNFDKSHHRVAFDLMGKISHLEKTPTEADAREYYLTLYGQCLKVVYHEKTFAEATKGKDSSSSMGIRF